MRILLWFVAGMAGVGRAGAQENRLAWPAPFAVQGYVFSSPALSLDRSTIYVGVHTRNERGRVFALRADGTQRWVLPASPLQSLPGAIDSSPAVGPDGTVYVGSAAGILYAINPENGTIRWEYNAGALAYITSSPAVGGDGTVYFGAGDGKVRAVRNNELVWAFSTGASIEFSSPAIAADGTIYIGSHDRNLYAIRPDGTERWRFPTSGIIDSSPAIGRDGTVYIGSNDQRVYAIAPDRTLRWEKLTNGVVQASPVIAADGSVIVASADTNLYALEPEDGSERWKVSYGATTQSTPAIRGDGVIILGADDNRVRAFSPDGAPTPLWTYNGVQNDGSFIEGSPLVTPDGSIYIGSSDGFFYKLAGNGSPLSTFSPWPAFRRNAQHTGRASAPPQDQLKNIATRARLDANDTLIAGFVVGVEPRTNLIRAVGPGLGAIGVGGFLPDPRLELYSGQVSVQRVDDWTERDAASGFSVSDTADAVAAFPFVTGSKDAAIVRPLNPGVFHAHVTSGDGRGGVALVEVYDTPGTTAGRLLNLSTRGRVGTGEDILIAGFVVGGGSPMRLLLRAIGPSLAQFGVSGVLLRPRLEVFRGVASVAVNTGWASGGFKRDLVSAAAAVSAFQLSETMPDAAIVFEAQPGPYTVQISGVNGTTGEGMVEIYVLP